MKKKILLAVIIVIVLLGAGGIYAYYATDVFKSNKEIFFDYFSEMFKDENLEKYVKKQENEAYTNKGSIGISESGVDNELNDELNDEETMQMLNNSQVIFEGKTDNNKKIAEQTVTMKLSEGIDVPIKIKRDGETIGIQSNLLDSKWIAIKNKKLKELFLYLYVYSPSPIDSLFDIDLSKNKIDFEKMKFTEEELKNLNDKYGSIVSKNLEESLFKKEKSNDQAMITLNLTEKKCLDIMKEILEELKKDDIVLNKVKVSGDMKRSDFKEKIENIIEEIDDIDESEEELLCIKMYTKSKKVEKIEIDISDTENNKNTGKIEISKEDNKKDLIYVVDTNIESEDEENISMNFKIKYKNIVELNNVEENYELSIYSQKMMKKI